MMNDYLITVLRALLSFTTLFVLVRLIGRKQISQITFADYIVGIVIGSLGANLTINKSLNVISGIIAVAVWCGLNILTGWLALKDLRVRKLIHGEPLIVIDQGQVHSANMAKANYSISDLLMQLREEGVFDITKVEYAILEANGQLSILKKAQQNTPTLYDMRLTAPPQGLMTELIVNGKILKPQLAGLKQDEKWLRGELAARGISELETVILAGIMADGQLYTAIENRQA